MPRDICGLEDARKADSVAPLSGDVLVLKVSQLREAPLAFHDGVYLVGALIPEGPRWRQRMVEMTPFATRLSRLGRNEQPRELYLAWRVGEIDIETLREWIVPVWELAEFPERYIGRRAWLEMFRAAGVVIEEPLPDFVQRLWRGCSIDRSRVCRGRGITNAPSGSQIAQGCSDSRLTCSRSHTTIDRPRRARRLGSIGVRGNRESESA